MRYPMSLEITEVEHVRFEYEVEDVSRESEVDRLVLPLYEPGNAVTRSTNALRIGTDAGVAGEYVTATDVAHLDKLVGENPLDREAIWDRMRHRLRATGRTAMGPIDVALWDLAGRYYDAPIYELLGAYRRRFPAYASTYCGDEHGGLDSPAAYADFAEECLDLGYRGYKIHVWPAERGRVGRHVETVHAVGERVGDGMDLMLDPACLYTTFGDAVTVGKACDAQDFFWYEDPYRDTGVSAHAHGKLRELLETPILQGEYLRGAPQTHTDFMANSGTDFVRADTDYDGGITGAMKLGRIAEGFGIDVEFHLGGPPSRHCIAALRNTNYYELGLVHPDLEWTGEIYAGDYSDAIDAIDDDGMVEVPEGPGLGVEYDWDFVEDHAVERTVY